MEDKTVEQRFWEKVDVRSEDECWEWTASFDSNGYGAFKFFGRKRNSHVVAYVISNGQVPEGREVCHTCNNRSCCNPSHLYAGTRLENVMDSMRAGTKFIPKNSMPGESNPRAILSGTDIVEIRNMLSKGVKPIEISGIYGVSKHAIYNIKWGKSWSSV